MAVIEDVRGFLVEQEYIKPDELINDSESMLERGMIDSVGVLNLVSFLEDRYKIEIEDDDLMPENFDSLAAINNYVRNKTV